MGKVKTVALLCGCEVRLNAVSMLFSDNNYLITETRKGNGATDSTSGCCIIRGTVAGFESLTIIRSPKCLMDPGYIIDT